MIKIITRTKKNKTNNMNNTKRIQIDTCKNYLQIGQHFVPIKYAKIGQHA